MNRKTLTVWENKQWVRLSNCIVQIPGFSQHAILSTQMHWLCWGLCQTARRGFEPTSLRFTQSECSYTLKGSYQENTSVTAECKYILYMYTTFSKVDSWKMAISDTAVSIRHTHFQWSHLAVPQLHRRTILKLDLYLRQRIFSPSVQWGVGFISECQISFVDITRAMHVLSSC